MSSQKRGSLGAPEHRLNRCDPLEGYLRAMGRVQAALFDARELGIRQQHIILRAYAERMAMVRPPNICLLK